MRTLRTILIFWVPLICWFLIIHNFSATPGRDLPRIDIPHADKLFHLVEYFVFGILLIRAFDQSNVNVSLAKLSILAIIIALCYGALDELFQRSVPGRSSDIVDYIVDCIGSLSGIILYISDTKERRG